MELLATHGPLSFKELKKETGVSVGSLYFHISVLGELLSQDERKRYLLTEIGRAAYKSQGSQVAITNPSEVRSNLPLTEKLAPIASGSLVIQGASLSPFRHFVEAMLIVGIGGWILSASGLEQKLLFLFERQTIDQTLILGTFVIGWLTIFAISDILSTLVFKSKGGHVSLLVTSSYSLLPLTIFSLIWLYDRTSLMGLSNLLDGWPIRILFFGLQGWSLLLLATSIRISKRLTTSKSFLIVLFLVYLNIAYVLIGIFP